MINLKTGAISLPGMLSNLLYKDITTNLYGTDDYTTYSDNSDFGPQTPDSFTVDRATLDSQIADIGQEYGKGVYGGLQSAVKGLASAWGGAMFGNPTMSSIIGNAIDYNAGKVPGNTSAIGKATKSASDMFGSFNNDDATIGDKIGSVFSTGYDMAKVAAETFPGLSSLMGAIGLAKNGLSALSDIAGLTGDTGSITGVSRQDLSNAINNAISSGLANPGYGGRPASQLDNFGIEDNINVPDIDISKDTSGTSGESSGGSSSSDGLGGSDSSSDRGSSRGMGGATGRGGEDSDEGSAGAGW